MKATICEVEVLTWSPFLGRVRRVLSETEVADPAAPPSTPLEAPTAPKDKPKDDEKESEEELAKRARKPPTGGKCIRCGEPKPINRLKLCYPCWVKSENEKKGWREGQPHPAGCGCDMDCVIDRPHN
ncbi:MAG: hypothetical protein PHS14_00390 [Elusimicrobia bacterium]|nr:hypothetical protein [Elusimicrobiota bacterium]